jgi:hypothetical protein
MKKKNVEDEKNPVFHDSENKVDNNTLSKSSTPVSPRKDTLSIENQEPFVLQENLEQNAKVDINHENTKDVVASGCPICYDSKPVEKKTISKQRKKVTPVAESTTTPQILEAGRPICHEIFYDGRVRRIEAVDAPDFGNQHHYTLEIQEIDKKIGIVRKIHREDIFFQKGNLLEHGPSGWIEGDLVKILIDRLTNSSNECPDIKKALINLVEADKAINKHRERKINERLKVAKAKPSTHQITEMEKR